MATTKMEIDKNGSPFIPLPLPHSAFIITPMRATDGPALIEILNDPSVYMYLLSPPFPFTQQSFDDYYSVVESQTQKAMAEYQEAIRWREERETSKQTDASSEKWVGAGQPVFAIRKVDEETREERMVGGISIMRQRWADIKDDEARAKRKKENDELPAGDPRIEWEIGCK
jgi:hypothetical protein